MFSSLRFNPPPASGLASQFTFTQQLQPVCTWSAYIPQSGPSPVPFPRDRLTLTGTATAASEFLLFGGRLPIGSASSDLYVFSARDFSTTLLQTSGKAPTPRFAHGAALIGTTLLICGGKMDFCDQDLLNNDSIYLLNLESLEWSHIVVNVPGSGCRYYHTTNVVGSKVFIFGGQIGGKAINDVWSLDLNCPKPKPFWELYEPPPGNKKPLPRTSHISITTEDRIIIFGGYGDQHYYNDTWSFDISRRKWTEIQCTGSIPSPRSGHAAVLVDGFMYVFGGFSMEEGYLDDLYALQLSTQRWFTFHNEGTSPLRRSAHAMASDGTRIFVLGGYSRDVRADEISLIHVFDTKDIKYPETEPNAVNPIERTTQLSWKSSTGPRTQEQPLHPTSSLSEAFSASRLQNATSAVSGRPAFMPMPITYERHRGPNGRPWELTGVNSMPRRVPENDVSEGSAEYYGRLTAPPYSSEVTRSELERQLSGLLAAQTERDQLIARQTDELELKSALLEQAELNAAQENGRARLELRKYEHRLLAQTSLVKQRDAELVDIQSKLRNAEAKFDGSLVSFDHHTERHGDELANVRAELGDGWAKSKGKGGKLHTVTTENLVDLNEDRDMSELKEDTRVMKGQLASPKWNEKGKEAMECRNEE